MLVLVWGQSHNHNNYNI